MKQNYQQQQQQQKNSVLRFSFEKALNNQFSSKGMKGAVMNPL